MVRSKRQFIIWLTVYTIIAWLISSVISLAQTTTTSNLTPNTFTTSNGWSGTNLYSTHGSGTIAGVSGKFVENTISLSSIGLSKEQINEGFTSTQGADIWFWSGNPNQNVTMTQVITNDNGVSTIQNRTINYTSSYFNNYQNIAVIDKNTQANFSITSRFSFYESTNSPYHAAADLMNPSLTVTYVTNPVPQVVISPIEVIQPVIQEVKITTQEIIEPSIITSEPVIETQAISLVAQPKEEIKNTSVEQSTEQPKEVIQEQSTTKQETVSEQNSSKENLSTSNNEVKTSASDDKTNVSNTQVDVKTKQQLDKVEKELKGVDTKVKSVQEIKIESLKSNQPSLSVYENKPFYAARQMVGVPNDAFYNQANLMQPSIYTNITLQSYTNKDPLATRHNMLKEIQDEQNDIIIQLEQLKRIRG
jgi:hypothetical protein